MVTASRDGKWIAGCYNVGDFAWIQPADNPKEVVELAAQNSRAILLASRTKRVFWNDGTTLCQRPLALQGETERLASFPQVINYLAISQDEKLLAIGLSTREVYLWDIEKNAQRGPALMQQDLVAGIAFTNDEQSVVTVDWSGNLRFWNIETGQLVIEVKLEPMGGVIHTVYFSKDRRFVCLRNNKGSILVQRLY